MKIIFLDIDGVMNSQVFYHERYKKRWFKLQTYKWWILAKTKWIFNGFKYKAVSLADYKIDPKYFEFTYTFKRLVEETDLKKWEWLSDFCNKNDYKICISSVWKNHFKKIDDWDKALIKLGFNNNVFIGITGNRKTLRGDEIKDFINKYGAIERYAILDDDSDMLPEQMNSFFHVDGYYGLTPYILYRIKRHFDKT